MSQRPVDVIAPLLERAADQACLLIHGIVRHPITLAKVFVRIVNTLARSGEGARWSLQREPGETNEYERQ